MLRAFAPKQLQSRVRDLMDTIRFMSKAERRRAYLGTAVVTSLTGASGYLAGHTLFCDDFMKMLQMYRNKMGIPVNASLMRLLDDTLNDMAIDTDSSVGMYNFVGNELYSVGSLLLPSGGYIGVPYNFNFTDVSQFKVHDIRLLGQYRTKRTASAPVIKNLSEASILSEDAKKYALAHEINLLTSSYIFAKSANIFFATMASFLLTPIVNKRIFATNSKRLPRILCGLMCFLTVTVFPGAIIDQLLDELYDIRALRRTLRTAARDDALAAKYQTGAVEFYTKLIERNKALFELLGDYGPTFCTEDGKVRRLFSLWKQSYEPHLAIATMAGKPK